MDVIDFDMRWERTGTGLLRLMSGKVCVGEVLPGKRTRQWKMNMPRPHVQHFTVSGQAHTPETAKAQVEHSFFLWCDLAEAGRPIIAADVYDAPSKRR